MGGYDLPYAGGVYRLSGGRTYSTFDATIVRLTTDTGHEGWGESTPFGPNHIAAHARGVRAGIEEIADGVLGLDPRRVNRGRARRAVRLTPRRGVRTELRSEAASPA